MEKKIKGYITPTDSGVVYPIYAAGVKFWFQVDNKEPTPTILEFSTTPEFTISDIKPDNYHE